MRNLTMKSGRQNLQVCLQCEDRMEPCGCSHLESHGLVFHSPRRLNLMANILVRIECPLTECRCRILMMEGIVIGSEVSADGWFENTVLFLQEQDSDSAESLAVNFPAAGAHHLN